MVFFQNDLSAGAAGDGLTKGSRTGSGRLRENRSGCGQSKSGRIAHGGSRHCRMESGRIAGAWIAGAGRKRESTGYGPAAPAREPVPQAPA